MCWSCSWMRRLCPEEWRWGFSQKKKHFMLGVQQPVICVHWWLLFLCVVGPAPGDGLVLHVWLTGRCSSSSPYPVSFYPIHLWVCAHRVNLSCPFGSEPLRDCPWYLTSVRYWLRLLVFFSVLSLKWISAIWWCPQWWASIVLLSSLASCLVHRTPTSHRYLTANFYMHLLSQWDITRN